MKSKKCFDSIDYVWSDCSYRCKLYIRVMLITDVLIMCANLQWPHKCTSVWKQQFFAVIIFTWLFIDIMRIYIAEPISGNENNGFCVFSWVRKNDWNGIILPRKKNISFYHRIYRSFRKWLPKRFNVHAIAIVCVCAS